MNFNPVDFVSNFIRLSTMNKDNYNYVTGLLEAFKLTNSISLSDYNRLMCFAGQSYFESYLKSLSDSKE